MHNKILVTLSVLVLVLSGWLLLSVARHPKVSVQFQKQHAAPAVSAPAANTDGTVQTQVNVLNDKVTTKVLVEPKKK